MCAIRASSVSFAWSNSGISTLNAPIERKVLVQSRAASAGSALAVVRPMILPPLRAPTRSRNARSAWPCGEIAPPIRTSAPLGSPAGDLRRRVVRVSTRGMCSVSVGRSDIAPGIARATNHIFGKRRRDLRRDRLVRPQFARVPRVAALLQHDMAVGHASNGGRHALISPCDVIVLREDRDATVLLACIVLYVPLFRGTNDEAVAAHRVGENRNELARALGILVPLRNIG